MNSPPDITIVNGNASTIVAFPGVMPCDFAFVEQAIANAKREFPDLGEYGFGPEYAGDFNPAQVWTAYRFLRMLEKSNRPTVSSYSVKHYAERWGRTVGLQPYVTNGAAIVAAHVAGFVVVRGGNCAAPCNAGIGIAKRDLEKIQRKWQP